MIPIVIIILDKRFKIDMRYCRSWWVVMDSVWNQWLLQKYKYLEGTVNFIIFRKKMFFYWEKKMKERPIDLESKLMRGNWELLVWSVQFSICQQVILLISCWFDLLWFHVVLCWIIQCLMIIKLPYHEEYGN